MEQVVRVERVADTGRMDQLAVGWRRLELAATVPTVFVRFGWQRAWVEHFIGASAGSRELCVLAVWEKEQLIGIAPWYLARRSAYGLRIREIRAIGYPETGADHLDILAARGREYVVAQALAGTLWGELGPQWDLLNLHEIPAASPVLYHLLNLIEEQGRQIDVPAGAYCPAFRLPEAIDGVVGGLGTRHREAYRRNLRAVHRAGRVEHLTWRGRDVGQQIRPVLRLHEARWPEHDKRLYPFVLELLEAPAGEIGAQLDCLLIDGEPCAGYLHFDTGSRRELYLLGVDRERHPEINVGKALLGGCLERAVGDGVKEYDFLKGGESYKFDWANTAHRSLRAEAPRRRAGTVLSWCVTQAKALGRILVR